MSKLPHVLNAVSPFAAPDSPQVAKRRHDRVRDRVVGCRRRLAGHRTTSISLDNAVAPARTAGCKWSTAAGPGRSGRRPSDRTSEIIGWPARWCCCCSCSARWWPRLMPLLSAIFSVVAGLSLLGLLAAAITFPTTAPTVATLLGLGVAIDYGLFLMARHREQLDDGHAVIGRRPARPTATSGAAIVVAGRHRGRSRSSACTSSGVPFVGALGPGPAIVVAVAMLAALTLMPAFMGVAEQNVLRRRTDGRRARRPMTTRRPGRRPTTDARSRPTSTAPSPAGAARSATGRGRGRSRRRACSSCSRSRCSRCSSGSWTPAPTRPADRPPGLRPDRRPASGRAPTARSPSSSTARRYQPRTTRRCSTQRRRRSPSTAAWPPCRPRRSTRPATPAVINVIPTTAPQDAATTELVDRLRDDVLPEPSPATTASPARPPATSTSPRRSSHRLPWLIAAVVLLAFILLTVAFRVAGHRHQGRRHEPAVGRGRLRSRGRRLPVGLGSGAGRHRARPCRSRPSCRC